MRIKTEDNIQTNTRNCLDLNLELPNSARLMLTAPKDQNYWLFGVALTKTQMLVAVPEFGGVNFHVRIKTASDYVAAYEASPRNIQRELEKRLKSAVSGRDIKEAVHQLKIKIRAWRGVDLKPVARD